MVPDQPQKSVELRFYEELNDYLSPARRKRAFTVELMETTPAGKLIATLGIPLAEVDLLLIDGESVGFDRILRGGERVAVYPVFERFDISPLARLPGRPLDKSRLP